MKKIEAFIRPEKLEEIRDALRSHKLHGLSITCVNGCGNQKGWKEYVRGAQVDVQFLPKIKIEIVTVDEQVEKLIDMICEKAHTGEVGDGKIFVTNVETAVRIRTKERNDDALK